MRIREFLRTHGAHCEEFGRNGGKARVKRDEKSIEVVGECIVFGAGFLVGGLSGRRCFLALRRESHLRRGALIWRGGTAAALVASATKYHSLRYGMGYARTTGRKDGLGAGGRKKIQNPTVQTGFLPPILC
jgi:hypothetical protein